MSSSKQVMQQSSGSSFSSSTSSSSKSVSVKSSSSTQSSSQKMSSSKMVTSSGATGSGLNVEGEMERMKLKMDEQMSRMRAEMRMLMPSSAGNAGQLIRLDEKSIEQYFDDSHKRIKFDVDVQEFANETVVVKSDGNKIEVHAKKFVKKGDDEHQEEYSRTYEMPSGMDTKMVTSSLQKDGNLLTIELPV